jgi:hypothetical protein
LNHALESEDHPAQQLEDYGRIKSLKDGQPTMPAMSRERTSIDYQRAHFQNCKGTGE